MGAVNRSIIMRCMRKALSKIDTRKSPDYSLLMTRTLSELATEGFAPESRDGFYQDVFAGLNQTDPLRILLTEGYGQLLALGYIVPRPDCPPNPNWFCITEVGHQWATGSDPAPEDQQGYLAAIDALVPGLDPVIRQYVQEALVTYERRAFFAAAVMIGAASEKAIYLLMDALLGAISSSAERSAIRNAIQKHGLPQMFKLLLDTVGRAKKSGAMPYTIHEGTECHLLSLQDAIRVQRNDAVHPQIGQATPETIRLTLASFPFACRKAYDLMEWFGGNQL